MLLSATPAAAQVAVDPDGVYRAAQPNATGLTAQFLVSNLSEEGRRFSLDCFTSGSVTSCSSPTGVPINGFSTVEIAVSFETGNVGPGTLQLLADDGVNSDYGSYAVNVQVFKVEVTPDAAGGAIEPTRRAGAGGYSTKFTVRNVGTDTDSYSLSCTGSGVTCGTMTPSSLSQLAPGASAAVTVNYTAGTAGQRSITLTATGSAGSTDAGSYTVPVAAAGGPLVDFSIYNFAGQDYGRCAASCFAAVHAQGTVPYFSLDAPRNIALVWNSDRHKAWPFVHVNVHPDTGFTPSEYRLQVKLNGTFVTFRNGETLLRFAYPGRMTARLGGQLDVSSTATGVYPLEILVTTYDAGTQSSITTSYATKLAVVNESMSPIAAGWTLSGIQRLYEQGDGSALITEGDGSAVYFAKLGSSFIATMGEFSRVTGDGTAGWTRVYPDSTKVLFNTFGRMTEVRDRFNNTSTVTYDGSNRVWQIKDPLNLTITLSYDGNGLTAIQDPGGRVTDIVVDVSKRLTTITDPDNVSTIFGYDASLRLQTITNRRGHATTLTYDAQSGKVLTVSPPAVEVVNADGSLATMSPETNLSAWHKKGVPYGSTGTPMVVPKADTVYGRLTDPGGHTSRFTVNRWGTTTVASDPLARTDSVRFDINGLPIRLRSSAGAVDSVVYDGNGLPTYAKASGLPGTRARYVGWAQPDSIWTEDGLSGVRNFIGPNGRVDSTRVAGGTTDAATTRFRYDSRGRVDSLVDPMHHLRQRTWYAGANGNRSKDSLPGGRLTTYGYDTHGRRTTISPPGLATTTMFYSIINRPDSVRDGVNPLSTRYGYDNLFLTSVTDPKGQVYGFTYNAVGWVTLRTDPVSRSDQYKYSRDGEFRRWINRRGDTITYAFDALHRPTSKSGANTTTDTWSYPSDTVVVASSPTAVDTLVANRHGQLLHLSTIMASQHYKRRYTYAAAGALDSVIPTGGGITFQSRKYIWNLRTGSLSDIKLGAAGTILTKYSDGLPRVYGFPGGDQVTLNHTSVHAKANATTSEAYGSTTNRYLSIDAAGRIDMQIFGSGIAGRTYDYDGLGRIRGDTAIAWITDGDPNPCDGDPMARVNENGDPCAQSSSGGSWETMSGVAFAYDSAGNRRDKGGQYTTGNRITNFDNCQYETDNDGNVKKRMCGADTAMFAWSAENRLSSVTVNGQTTSFDYNAGGRLVRKTAGSVVRHFVWESDNPLAELDGAGTAKVAEYSYYPGLDNPHAMIVGTTKYFAHRDGTGNVIALTDEAKALKRSYGYDAWGNLVDGWDHAGFNGIDRARFKGALWLGPEIDMSYMRARWYEPKTGRFLSEDPIGLDGGINPHVFAGDDPVNSRDPRGLDESPCPDGYDIKTAKTVEYDGVVALAGDCEATDGSGRAYHFLVVIGYTLPAVIVSSCQYCSWSNSPEERERHINEALSTVSYTAGRTTFTMEGMSITLSHPGHVDRNLNPLRGICQDAAITAQVGHARFLGGAALIPFSIAMFRKGTGLIGTRYAWNYMKTGAGTVTFAYGVHQALGC
jgi:RHS repeat-associated protein